MGLHQDEVIPIATACQPNQRAQKLTKRFHQTKKTVPVLSYKDITDENVKPVLNMLAVYEPSDEITPSSINNARDITTSLTCVSAAIQDPKYHVNSQNTSNMATKIHERTKPRSCSGFMPRTNIITAGQNY